MGLLGGNDTDILPTGHHRKVTNRYSTSSSDISFSTSSSSSPLPLILNIFFVGCILVISINHNSSYGSLQKKYQSWVEKERKTLATSKDLQQQLEAEKQKTKQAKIDSETTQERLNIIKADAEEERKKLNRLDTIADTILEERKDRVGKTISILGHAYSDYEIEKRHEKQKENVRFLQKRIKEISHREVMERFGEGPHQVKIDVFIPSATGQPEHGSFTIQLAPLDTMPHTVHLFLEQVYHHLWDGCAFLLADAHRLQASPYRDIKLTDRSLEKKFRKLDLDTVSFQEYNASFPHVQYSLGYSGRPGGPDFYISLVDNTKRFGPAGKDSRVLEEEADPAFGMVVGGLDVIEKMVNVPKLYEKSDLFKEPVVIVQANVLGIKPGQYRHSFFEGGYFGLHDYEYYAEEEKPKSGEQEIHA